MPKIGALFDGRDPTTVMCAHRKIRNLMLEWRSICNQVTELTNRIKNKDVLREIDAFSEGEIPAGVEYGHRRRGN